jgi:hypothetical protein
MNPNQMMIAKAMVSQTALREEARESRRRRTNADGPRTARNRTPLLSLLGRR